MSASFRAPPERGSVKVLALAAVVAVAFTGAGSWAMLGNDAKPSTGAALPSEALQVEAPAEKGEPQPDTSAPPPPLPDSEPSSNAPTREAAPQASSAQPPQRVHRRQAPAARKTPQEPSEQVVDLDVVADDGANGTAAARDPLSRRK
jgi:hypothetical protein